MIITLYGYVKNGEVYSDDVVYRRLYDPNGLLVDYNNQDNLVITLKVFVSKGGKLVTLVDRINNA